MLSNKLIATITRFSLIFLSACFSLRIAPEKINSSNNLLGKNYTNRGPEVQVCLVQPKESSKLLGNQFILLFFPLTRLYLEESPQAFAKSTLEKVLDKNGYQLMPTSNECEVSSSYCTVTVDQASFSSNVYDLLFIRRAAVDGFIKYTLQGSCLKKSVTEFVFDSSEYRATAFAAYISYFLNFELEKAWEEEVKIWKFKDSLVRNFKKQ